MRLQDIVGIIRDNFFQALVPVVGFMFIFLIGYILIYRKLMKGEKALSKKQILYWGMFTGYVIMVIGVTFLNRGHGHFGGVNLDFFSTYREAWNSFSLRNWQFVILNIVMFVPFGIFFPLLHQRFRKAVWTIGAATLFTLSIESFQLVTRFGNFVVDDLFNNLVGGIIGYGTVMGAITIRKHGRKSALLYFTPLILVVILFGSMFTFYHFKEFGNLSIAPSQRINMTNAVTSVDIELNDQRTKQPVYQAPAYTNDEANEFVEYFFEKINVDSENMEVTPYQNEAVYSTGEYSIWFYFLDGSYRYTDFSSFNETIDPKNVDEDTLKESLKRFDIDLPSEAEFEHIDTGSYEWRVDKKEVGDQLIDGFIGVRYYNDDTIKGIENQLVTYDKVRDVQIKSEQEAYNEILAGNFQFYSDNSKVESLHVDQVEVSYWLDSKGFYQPVFAFHSIVDGNKMTILIPGM